MFGWEGLARDVSKVYLSLPEDEREKTVVLARNYGEAGALEYYTGTYPLPRVVSTHNSYWVWGYPEEPPGTVIILRGDIEHHRQGCDEVVPGAVHTCPYCLPYENNLPIYICRGLRVSLADVWKDERAFR